MKVRCTIGGYADMLTHRDDGSACLTRVRSKEEYQVEDLREDAAKILGVWWSADAMDHVFTVIS